MLSSQGNLEFVDAADKAQIKDADTLKAVAHLLDVDEKDAERALCSRVVAAKGDVMEKGHTIEQAGYGRDAFAKVRLLHLNGISKLQSHA